MTWEEQIAPAADPRREALVRAGIAVALALALLLALLWYEDGEAPAPPARPAQEIPASQIPAPDIAAPPPTSAPDILLPEAPVEAETASAAASGGETERAPEESGQETGAAAPQPPLPDGYLVQLGVFGSMDNAESLRKNAKALHLPAHLQTRVVVGPFRSKREAEAARERLKSVSEGIILPPRHSGGAARRAK
ncbi:MAG: SPOR domain-containing protein [Azoarcus sp.]|jgi:DedD protein|nr:SPOR domain-containing protein [Azoarcus sp.]